MIAAEKGFEKNISGTTAGLVIGDRAFAQRLTLNYHYDLGLAWKEMTGLPFVFAAWVSNKKMTMAFSEAFNNATALGLNQLDTIAALNPYTDFNLLEYYKKNISYTFDEDKKKALAKISAITGLT